ncbi:MFS transporter [Cyclobacterium plantarum]|uniref:MFS transporter n=1 Tax=Cyclobacterium plantarum TaxID=2716263 RepID=A0ABX0H9P5_9BACT|nr:MFS transporter [Cyclobacterium plantarum]NHE56917.1 MFS transporter [Cyclobacterium plantarum]
MKKLFKPASLLFSLLSLVVFFLIGMLYAGWIDAGKGQGLAGGAIVLGWGVIFALIAFVVSFFLTYRIVHKKIIVLNWVLFALLLAGYGIIHYNYVQREKSKEKNDIPPMEKPNAPSKTTDPASMLTSFNTVKEEKKLSPQNMESITGMGFFSPDFYENQVLYFYSEPNLEKPIQEHAVYDSITFRQNQHRQFEIATAPPWLVPDIMKLDYDMLYFKISSVSDEWVEIVVNAQNGQTAYISKYAGNVVYWPDFLLSVNSVEFLPGSEEKVRARPFSASGIIRTPYEFMKPFKIKEDWAEVFLLDGGFQRVGKGWIQWKKGDKLLVQFNLLS